MILSSPGRTMESCWTWLTRLAAPWTSWFSRLSTWRTPREPFKPTSRRSASPPRQLSTLLPPYSFVRTSVILCRAQVTLVIKYVIFSTVVAWHYQQLYTPSSREKCPIINWCEIYLPWISGNLDSYGRRRRRSVGNETLRGGRSVKPPENLLPEQMLLGLRLTVGEDQV